MKRIVALILTFNEEIHLERCLESIDKCVDQILIVDSFSTDATVEIARRVGARVIQNPWINYARQFQFGCEHIDDDDFVFRIDADEYLDAQLRQSIIEVRESADAADAYVVRRYMTFMRKKIRYGGVFPVNVLRIYRNRSGQIESRWMDEHISVGCDVKVSVLEGELVDDSKKPLSWWVDKHNVYASREAVDVLLAKYGYKVGSVASWDFSDQASIKRTIKEKFYNRSPAGFRAVIYFLYRYLLRLGFLDGARGLYFHVLQGFWYRFLVDCKVSEVESIQTREGCTLEKAIALCLNIKVELSEG